ncbi:MAG: alpha/beta hydrolase [Turicibacter sp.]|nr:alpha/beta hydrolase [Turicibacter sp.]
MQVALLIITAILLIVFLGLAIMSYIMFCSFLKREKKGTDTDAEFENLPEQWKLKYRPVYEHKKAERAWFLSLPYKELQVKSDGYTLNGYYLSQQSKKTAIILHGHKRDALDEAGEIRFYYDMGYNIFIPDIRSHGKSQGKYIGMGCVDRGDIIKWIDLLHDNNESDCGFILVGFSMGGATALALSGNIDLPPSVAAIISHSSFTSIKELMSSVIKMKPTLIKNLLIFGFEIWCKLLVGYGFNDNTPEQGVQKSKTPIMIIHGAKDNLVPLYMSEKLFSLCISEKAYWVDENAGHDMVGWYEKEVYQSQIRAFLNKYVK